MNDRHASYRFFSRAALALFLLLSGEQTITAAGIDRPGLPPDPETEQVDHLPAAADLFQATFSGKLSSFEVLPASEDLNPFSFRYFLHSQNRISRVRLADVRRSALKRHITAYFLSVRIPSQHLSAAPPL